MRLLNSHAKSGQSQRCEITEQTTDTMHRTKASLIHRLMCCAYNRPQGFQGQRFLRRNEVTVTDTLVTKITGFLILIAVAAEYAAIGVIVSHGVAIGEFTEMAFRTGEQLVMLEQSRWAVTVFSLGVLPPCLFMLVWPGMYQVLAPGGPSSFFGVIVSSLGCLFAVVEEAIRLSVVTTLAPAYVAATVPAKPAILAMAATFGNVLDILRYTHFATTFAVGTPLIAIAILRGRTVSSWLGWSLLVPSVLMGYIGAPLLMFGLRAGGLFLGVGMNVFLLWLLAMAVVLFRWQPPQSIAKVGG